MKTISKTFSFNMPSNLRRQVVSILLSGKPIHAKDVIEQTGCTKYHVYACRKWLREEGHVLPVKKQEIKPENRFVISGKSEKDADEAREKQKKSRSEAMSRAAEIRQRLDDIAYQRELKHISESVKI